MSIFTRLAQDAAVVRRDFRPGKRRLHALHVAACLSLLAWTTAAATAGDPAKGLIESLAEAADAPGTRLVTPEGAAHPVIVTDRRAGAPVLNVRLPASISIVTLADNVRHGPPIDSYAQIAVPRTDRLAHLRKITTRSPVVKQQAEMRGGISSGAAGALRIVGRQDFMVMHGRRPDHGPELGEPTQVYVAPIFDVSVPCDGGEALVSYTPMAGPGDPDQIAGELWQYKVPDDADGDAEPRWVLVKPLTGIGSFNGRSQPFTPPRGL